MDIKVMVILEILIAGVADVAVVAEVDTAEVEIEVVTVEDGVEGRIDGADLHLVDVVAFEVRIAMSRMHKNMGKLVES